MNGENPPNRADFTDAQLAAIHYVKERASELLKHHRERLRELLLDLDRTYENIAAELLPNVAAIKNRTRRSIIAHAAPHVLTEEELTITAFARMSKGARRSVEQQGRHPWSDDERILFLNLCLLPEHQYPPGSSHPGLPNYAKIASILNGRFHEGNPVRVPEKLPSNRLRFLDAIEREQGIQRARKAHAAWSDAERARLGELSRMVLHPAGHTHHGQPDYRAIARILNQEFHSEALETGVAIRDERRAKAQTKFLRNRGQDEEPAH